MLWRETSINVPEWHISLKVRDAALQEGVEYYIPVKNAHLDKRWQEIVQQAELLLREFLKKMLQKRLRFMKTHGYHKVIITVSLKKGLSRKDGVHFSAIVPRAYNGFHSAPKVTSTPTAVMRDLFRLLKIYGRTLFPEIWRE